MWIEKVRKELKVYEDKFFEFYGDASEESQEFKAYLKVVGKVLSKAEDMEDMMVFLTGITGGDNFEFRALKSAEDWNGSSLSLYLNILGNEECTEVDYSTVKYNHWGEVKIKSKLGVKAVSKVESWKDYVLV